MLLNIYSLLILTHNIPYYYFPRQIISNPFALLKHCLD